MVPHRRALTTVFCIAFGVASHGCFGGPTSDWPDRNSGDEDDDDKAAPSPDGPKRPPSNAADAGVSGRGPLDASSGAFRDAGVKTEAGDDAGDASRDSGQVDDAGVAVDAALHDAGVAEDATVARDAGATDAADASGQRDY